MKRQVGPPGGCTQRSGLCDAGVNLLMALKLPGQVYDEGNFFPKDETSDSEEPDLPPWDAELTKRPKRVPLSRAFVYCKQYT